MIAASPVIRMTAVPVVVVVLPRRHAPIAHEVTRRANFVEDDRSSRSAGVATLDLIAMIARFTGICGLIRLPGDGARFAHRIQCGGIERRLR